MKNLHKHYSDSKKEYLSSGIKGESHLEFYRDKYPENYLELIQSVDNK